ncbi:MAG: cysteine desulfurase family protein [Candidatus Helarchaeota archaeon]
MRKIYFDNAASTRVDERVIRAMEPYFGSKYGNASSIHGFGREAKEAIENARKIIAKRIGARAREIIFTSGGTEGNNFVLKGLFFSNYPRKNHIITSKIEHDCILNACKWLESLGARVTYLDVDKEGFIDLEQLEKAINERTFLVSIMQANNEVGTIQNLKAIGEICKKRGVLFHTDACQSFTKVPLDVNKMNLDLVTLNSHKIHGPKGVGAVYIREGIKITPLLHGGGHEKGLRSGTENVSGIVGFGKAVEISSRKDVEKMEKLRDILIEGILKIPNVKLNGPKGEKRLCNNVNVCFNDIEGESIGGYLESKGIFVSTGSACASHTLASSHVLRAMGLSPQQINSSIRISISRYTSEEEVRYFLKVLPKIVKKLRRFSALR